MARKKAQEGNKRAAARRGAGRPAGKTTAKAKKQEQDPTQEGNSEPARKPEHDIAKVRENIHNLVTFSAEQIAGKLIEAAEDTPQLASAKYLFEAVGLYPATEAIAGKAQGDPLAEALLRRLGLPTAPGDSVSANDTKKAAGGKTEFVEEDQGVPPS